MGIFIVGIVHNVTSLQGVREIRPNLEIRRILQQFLCVLLVEIAIFFLKKKIKHAEARGVVRITPKAEKVVVAVYAQ